MTEITSDVQAKIVALWLTIAFEPIIHKLSLSKVKYERKRIEGMEIKGNFCVRYRRCDFILCDILDVIVCIYIMVAVPKINISNSVLSIRIESIDNSSTDSMGQWYCETPKWFVCLLINKKKCGSDSNCFFPFISSTKTKIKQIFVKKTRKKCKVQSNKIAIPHFYKRSYISATLCVAYFFVIFSATNKFRLCTHSWQTKTISKNLL